jgi:putative lipoprotein (rSAM/lipoprotein system)
MAHISKVYRMVITALLASLGFSCMPWGWNAVAEYGTPSATYKVKGIVVSEADDSPIKGIRATLKTNLIHYKYDIDTTYTDNEGFFFLEGVEFPNQNLIIELIDVDDGSFISMEIEADFTDKTFTGSSGNWYYGEAEMDLGIIKMKPE